VVDLPIIVEGPDGGGKTTVAKDLCEKLERVYCRPSEEDLSSTGGPGGIGLVEWWDSQLGKSSLDLGGNVYDRCFYISDPIYQQAQPWRGLLVPSEDTRRGIMRLWGVEPIIIFCLPPFEVQLANVTAADRSRLKGVADDQLLKISNQYHAYYGMWANALYDNVMTYDYTEEEAWERLLERLASIR
jgi:hypothetical protein